MSIRYRTVKAAAARNRRLWRVRRRAYETPSMPDCDGDESRPSTWKRCEEEYFSHFGYAMQACEASQDCYGRAGFLDQVRAGRVLDMMERAGMDLSRDGDFEMGRYRVLGPVEVEHERITGVD